MSDATEIQGCAAALLDYSGETAGPLQAERDYARLKACIEVFQSNETRNAELYDIYEGAVPLRTVPDFVPARYRNLRIGCPWPAIAVQSVVERSQFDGYVLKDKDGATAGLIRDISDRNCIQLGYQGALIDAQVTGVSFACVVRDEDGAAVRWHTAKTAAGLWSWRKNQLECGFAIVDRMRKKAAATGKEHQDTVPSAVDFYTEQGVWEVTRAPGEPWRAEFVPQPMGECQMVAIPYQPDGTHPLGRSRFTRPMRNIVQEYMSNALNLHVATEFTAIGQKWATGLSDEQFAAFAENKWSFAADVAALATDNPATGGNPQFGNFTQQSMEPILSVKRSLAMDFAAASSIPISELLTQDSNPTSAEALAAAKDKLISLVESVNVRSRAVLRRIGLMLLCIEQGKALSDLTDEERGLMVHMREPSTPTAAAMADSALKATQAIEGYGKTDVCLERMNFDESERARIRAQIDAAEATAALNALADQLTASAVQGGAQ